MYDQATRYGDAVNLIAGQCYQIGATILHADFHCLRYSGRNLRCFDRSTKDIRLFTLEEYVS